ncbi:MAG TPA: ATP-grasp domain-containing protein, partial [Chondromyces sp.]|nr:ATP-grasp domain-containing protein [Chondromyces sp.]
MKKILIIGSGFLQVFVIKKAKEMGYHTITIDKNPNSIGFQYADEYEVIDIVDQEACLKYALSKNINGVITAATDYGVLSAAYIAKKMNLLGLDYEVAKVIKNKYMVRRTLFENNVDDISRYYEISNINQLDKISATIHFPVMVKPCDGSGSKAAKRVDSIADLREACEEAINASLIGKALVEDFIEGKEYGVESLVFNGEVHVLGIMGKYMTEPPNYAELGHC